MLRSFKFSSSIALLICGICCRSAVSFDSIVTLGDSLLDDADGIRSPVAAEHLADRLGVPLTKLAEFGATSAELIDDGQHTAAAASFGPDDLAVLWIGGNDFFGSAVGIATGARGFLDELEANVATAMDALHTAGINILALNLPDFAKTPVIQETINAIIPTEFLKRAARENFTAATIDWNSRLSQLAEDHGAAVVDVFQIVEDLWQSPSDFALLGNEPVLSHDWGCQFCVFADVAHPGSYAQGYIANEAMAVVDSFFNTPAGDPLEPLSAIEIARLADLIAGDFDGSGAVSGEDLTVWEGEFGQSGGGVDHSSGDANADGRIDGSDFTWWQRQFGDSLNGGATTAIPEPATIAGVLLCFAALCCWRLSSRRATA